jgi:hypothetical protein
MPSVDPSTTENEKMNAAYSALMRAKYPTKPAPTVLFKFFDPHDAEPDWNKGIAFLDLPDEMFAKRENERGLTAFTIFMYAKKTPKQAGWYLSTGKSWLYIAPTVNEVISRFQRLVTMVKPSKR